MDFAQVYGIGVVVVFAVFMVTLFGVSVWSSLEK
jgi:hypothetical protein